MSYYYDPGATRRQVCVSSCSDNASLVETFRTEWIAGPEHPEGIWTVNTLDALDVHRFPESRNSLINRGCHFDQARNWLDRHYPTSHQLGFSGICLTAY